MKELIGIKSPCTTILNPSMKRELLMFDKVGILSLSDVIEGLNELPDELGHYLRAEYDLLLDAGLIFEAKDPRSELLANLKGSTVVGQHVAQKALSTPEEEMTDESIEHLQQALLQSVEDLRQGLALLKGGEDKIRQIESNSIISPVAIDNLKTQGILTEFGYLKMEDVDDDFWREFISFEYWARKISILLREIKGMQAYPILALETHYLEKPESEKADVVSIVLNALPIPNESASWEQIIDYRNDSDAISNFLALKNWMNDVAKAKLSQDEIEDKLRYLIDRYQRFIKLHEMKVDTGMLETIVVASAEFLENLVKFKWGEIAKGLFSIRHRRIALIEGELTAPGNEIAYIVKTRNAFTQ